jgi:hypothetical protein
MAMDDGESLTRAKKATVSLFLHARVLLRVSRQRTLVTGSHCAVEMQRSKNLQNGKNSLQSLILTQRRRLIGDIAQTAVCRATHSRSVAETRSVRHTNAGYSHHVACRAVGPRQRKDLNNEWLWQHGCAMTATNEVPRIQRVHGAE